MGRVLCPLLPGKARSVARSSTSLCGAQVAPGQTVLDVGAHVGTFAQGVAEFLPW